jgi:hypothetical protein
LLSSTSGSSSENSSVFSASFEDTNGVSTEALSSTILEQSSAMASSCLKTWPTFGSAGMKIPALA